MFNRFLEGDIASARQRLSDKSFCHSGLRLLSEEIEDRLEKTLSSGYLMAISVVNALGAYGQGPVLILQSRGLAAGFRDKTGTLCASVMFTGRHPLPARGGLPYNE
ncbi:hypothetical protein [Pseudomonas putida]|uniref:hypothetical protein n=1 Tax=Pseudomonas putida TaxID=303 RepID=UPI003D989E9D